MILFSSIVATRFVTRSPDLFCRCFAFSHAHLGVVSQKDKQKQKKQQHPLSMAAATPTAAQRLEAIPDVEIDPEGVFKYVLISVCANDDSGDPPTKLVVRGNADAEYHADVYEDFRGRVESSLGVDCVCKGGGRINHDVAGKTILVYGHSMGFGRADHSKTVALLKKAYPNYSSITFNNDGY